MKILEPLPYAYDSLEPYIDQETMHIHFDKHYNAYFNKFIKAIEGTELEGKDVKEILKELNFIPEKIKQTVINNGGGYFNHRFFWNILKKDVEFKGKIAEEINNRWESFEKFKKELSQAALTQFGSGWAWLVYDKKNNKLKIIKTANQDCPLSNGYEPLIVIDIWEHAYYLKYQNKRNEFVENFFNIINWEKVDKLYSEAKLNENRSC
ncbi:superoxide dismutase [archaeon]|jgi:superoxide dismutase, Fe-Mn family|nr:superoxide dismutase [archaeon]MBT3450358.1 superoxide dismutase [archaeon]MBT6868867.1 superoxide dismutase [archaeon]MBT7192912.1 superoxide dismutase [archaeon]MBT7380878.1 superoxide dismutase [archaeon]